VTTSDYLLGSNDAEISRLRTQAVMAAEPTELLLQRGGIQRGMRVLDLGAGPGDVAFQVAGMVGPEGYVVGLEQEAAQIAVAEHRRAAMGIANIEFREGDARTFVDDELFDAVVCRFLLVHLPDAPDVLAHHVGRNLRARGIVVAIDYDIGGAHAIPEVELYSRLLGWVRTGFQYAQADPFVGMRLPVLFEQAGLKQVGSLGVQDYASPGSRVAPAYAVGVVRAVKAAIIASGAATEEELGLDTLEQRLVDAMRSANAMCTLATVVGAWGRRPE
jgi:SAM-dependent methyltransferase